MMSSKSEGILVISCNESSAESVILHILEKCNLPEEIIQSNIKGYNWSFETKYYCAEVKLYAANEKKIFDSEFCDVIKAIVFYFDDRKTSSFDEILSWIPFLKGIEAEVQLLVCDNSLESPNEEHRKNVLNWCVKNQYEFIELNELPDTDNEEGSIKDVTGYERVRQSLQSHPWANLIMKDNQKKDNVLETKENISGAENNEESASPQNSNSSARKITVENEELELEDQWMANVLNGDDPDGESFEALFSKFASMKDRASGLNGEERKKYAEKVAVAFWRAMGGDEDEIEGLDEDD